MRVQELLQAKGGGVVAIASTSTIAAAIEKLAVERIGTVLVPDEEGELADILAERGRPSMAASSPKNRPHPLCRR